MVFHMVIHHPSEYPLKILSHHFSPFDHSQCEGMLRGHDWNRQVQAYLSLFLTAHGEEIANSKEFRQIGVEPARAKMCCVFLKMKMLKDNAIGFRPECFRIV